MKLKSGYFSPIILAVLLLSNTSSAQIRLPRLVRDSMILQRDKPIKIWGWASKNEKINILWQGKKYATQADSQGNWTIDLAATKAGGPFVMQLKGKNQIQLKDILVGDVWICSGQSNMEHQMKFHQVYYPDEIRNANNPNIRQFKVPNVIDLNRTHKDLPSGDWKWANPTNVLDFSAVAYFYAEALYAKYKVPIGLINVTWGGSPIEAWMSEESLKEFPKLTETVLKNKDFAYVKARNEAAAKDYAALPFSEDEGVKEKWYSTDYSEKGNHWLPFSIPGYWEDQGAKNLHGNVWFRKEINLSDVNSNGDDQILMGRIVDGDEVYVNGQKVGGWSYMYPERHYAIPNGLLKNGKNLIAVKITNYDGKGGFVPDKPYELITDKDTIDLQGKWNFKVGNIFLPHKPTVPPALTLQYQPTALFNAMLSPVIGYSIKGFIWYQGESNAGDANGYAQLQPTMIQDWRKRWNDNKLPFFFVQLPGFMDYSYLPTESGWAKFREAQAKTISVLPNTGMAVAIDLGEWNDIHPDRKKPVGQRLALAAEKIAYGESIESEGPTLQSQTIKGNKIILTFDHAKDGLKTNDKKTPKTFAIAGEDKHFYWAEAKIEGNKIILTSAFVAEPAFARYAWADMPLNPNLVNQSDLPAPPFRTDK